MSYSPKFRGTLGQGSSRQLATNYINGLGSILVKGTPVSTNTSGQMILVDVSDQVSVQRLVGVCAADTSSGASGQVVDGGRLEDVTTSYTVGTSLYIDKTGAISSVVPSVGVGSFTFGDFAIFVGVVVKNEFDPTKKDIKLMLSVIAQL